MAELAEIVLAANEILEGAKKVKEGIVEGWETITEGYNYIASFFGSETGTGHYNNNLLANSLCARLWILPSDFERFLNYASSTDIVDNIQRAQLFSRFFEIRASPAWRYGFRFPDTVCVPLLNDAYSENFNAMYNSLNSISLIIKFNSKTDILPIVANYSNHLEALTKLYSSGVKFKDRATFETMYKLKWIIS